MKSTAFYAVIGIGALLVIGIILWGFHLHGSPVGNGNENPRSHASADSASTSPSLAGESIYANGEYGFSIFYPGSFKTTTEFDTAYHLPNTWRVNALQDATGTPIFEIIGYQTKSDTSYPRYYTAEVRIGASADAHEVAACDAAGNGEVAQQNVVLNNTTWHVFTLQDAGMMQYLKGTSYRTVHEGTCFALEELATGSDYRDASPSTDDIPDSVLTQHYSELTPIIQSFSFARS